MTSSLAPTTFNPPLASIWIDRPNRQRRNIETSSLEDSIKRVGLLHPVTVRQAPGPNGEPYQLLTGERRFTSCKNLGHAVILARLFESLDPIQAQIVELEENIKREDLGWKEIVESVARIHSLYCSVDPERTASDTADSVGLNPSTISLYFRVWREWDDPRVQQSATVREAYNILARRDQRAQGDALAELMEVQPLDMPEVVKEAMLDHRPAAAEAPVVSAEDLTANISVPERSYVGTGEFNTEARAVVSPPPPAAPYAPVLCQSFLDWAPQYSGPKFSLVHCDFPYGVNLFDGKQGRGLEPGVGYSDTPEVYFELLNSFCTHLDRFMSGSAHLMFWCSADTTRVAQTLAVFAKLAPSLEFSKFPLIWFKTDNAGISSDARRSFRHVYEHCLFARRSSRHLLQVKGDAYGSPTQRSLHASTKPEPMLKHFMSALVDSETSVFDPTCGSGSSLLAAEALGAKRVLGLEIDQSHVHTANQNLRNARSLRNAGK